MQRRWGLHRTGQSQPSARGAAETVNRFARVGVAGRPAWAAERTQRNAPQIASDRGADGDSFRPGPHSNIRGELATSTAQGELQQAAERPSEQCPGWEKRERGGVVGDALVLQVILVKACPRVTLLLCIRLLARGNHRLLGCNTFVR